MGALRCVKLVPSRQGLWRCCSVMASRLINFGWRLADAQACKEFSEPRLLLSRDQRERVSRYAVEARQNGALSLMLGRARQNARS